MPTEKPAPVLVFKREAWTDVAATLRLIADEVERDSEVRMAALVMIREDGSLAVYGLGPESACELRLIGILQVGVHMMSEGFVGS